MPGRVSLLFPPRNLEGELRAPGEGTFESLGKPRDRRQSWGLSSIWLMDRRPNNFLEAPIPAHTPGCVLGSISVLLLPGKARRLKQAKEEAQMEVEQYRREREQEFQSKQQAAMGSQGNLSAEVEQATRRQVQGMQSSQQRNRERVLAQLLGMVCDVRPQVHPNYRITV
ncbi:V-type proton ATPase subunit G 2 isoform X1 [Meriones unguiculatus]|uniref:V-type proton ATPase subunit G 2 isoform X1 n=1 Tax=Meriones unguiculatus TaxID=10047 RepID=UPI000B4F7D07|nr:V-type proton ATPase subunit G 2 isoform X1 [Meriones unguiculatus]